MENYIEEIKRELNNLERKDLAEAKGLSKIVEYGLKNNISPKDFAAALNVTFPYLGEQICACCGRRVKDEN